MPRFATLTPDGSRVVFESLGRLYSKSAKGRDAPAPLTGDGADALEAFPAFSRDGSRLAYVRWNDDKLGEIILADALEHIYAKLVEESRAQQSAMIETEPLMT